MYKSCIFLVKFICTYFNFYDAIVNVIVLLIFFQIVYC